MLKLLVSSCQCISLCYCRQTFSHRAILVVVFVVVVVIIIIIDVIVIIIIIVIFIVKKSLNLLSVYKMFTFALLCFIVVTTVVWTCVSQVRC